MPGPDLDSMLEQSVLTVLENMFFTTPLGPATTPPADLPLQASLHFHGPIRGTLVVSVSAAAARTLAAGFLGEDEASLSDSQPGQMVCELANMLCGWLISNLEEESFVLEPPTLLDSRSQQRMPAPPSAQRSFAIDNGTLAVSLYSTVPA